MTLNNFIGLSYTSPHAAKRYTEDLQFTLSSGDAIQFKQTKSKNTLLTTCWKTETQVLFYEDEYSCISICGSPTILLPGQQDYQQLDISNISVLSKLHRKEGTACLERLNNGFSIVIINKNTDQTLLSIDRMGIGQLFYQRQAEYVLYSSSLHLLTRLNCVNQPINLQAIYSYLYFHCIPAPETIYKDIFKLSPAEVLIIKGTSLARDCFWQPQFNEDRKPDIPDLQNTLRQTLSIAVKDCTATSAQHTGSFLSGGTDSSTLAGLLKQHSPENSATVSIGFEEQGYDEMEYAMLAAKHFGNKPYQYYVTFADITNSLDTIVDAYDEPFGNSSAVPTYVAAKFALEQGITHLLAGDGGDELFGGNERYTKQKVFDPYLKIPAWLRGILFELPLSLPISEKFLLLRKAKSYTQQASVPMPQRTQTYNFLHRNVLTQIFTYDYLAEIDPTLPISSLQERYNETPENTSLLNKMLYLDWKFTLADNDLRKVSTMCRHAGVQVSYPFLDNRVIEHSTKIPSRLKIKGTKLRYFYKQTFKNFLPIEIITKQKHGFGLPFGMWLKKDPYLQNIVYDALSELKKRELFKPEFLDQMIKQHRESEAAYYGTFVWVFAMLEFWLRSHNKSF
jgi:asparagine synthase (glutamine-hydrolysing)